MRDNYSDEFSTIFTKKILSKLIWSCQIFISVFRFFLFFVISLWFSLFFSVACFSFRNVDFWLASYFCVIFSVQSWIRRFLFWLVGFSSFFLCHVHIRLASLDFSRSTFVLIISPFWNLKISESGKFTLLKACMKKINLRVFPFVMWIFDSHLIFAFFFPSNLESVVFFFEIGLR